MTNIEVSAFIAQMGERIFGLLFDNQQTVWIGYNLKGHDKPRPGFVSVKRTELSDLRIETIGGKDYIGVVTQSPNPNDADKGIYYIIYHATETLQSIMVMGEGFENYRIDPLGIK